MLDIIISVLLLYIVDSGEISKEFTYGWLDFFFFLLFLMGQVLLLVVYCLRCGIW